MAEKITISETRTRGWNAGFKTVQWRALLRSPYTLLLTVFIVSRIFYYLLGVRFDARGLSWYLQIIDPELLRHDLLRSLFFLHWQPPGYNLFLGIVLKLFPFAYAAAFHAIHVALGAAVMCCLFYCMRRLGVRVWLAVAITLLFMTSPGVILYENLLFYEYPITFLLTVSIAFLFRFFESGRTAGAVWFLACLFMLVLVRNQFHLVYYLLVFTSLLFLAGNNRRVVTFAGSVFLALILALFLKNLALFGRFTSSTWDIMGFAPLLLHGLTPEERRLIIEQGKLSPAAISGLCGAPSATPVGIPLSTYYRHFTMPPKTGVPVLDSEFTSRGAVNYNHLGYLEVQKTYKSDIAFILRHYPQAYFRNVAIAWYAYFLPSGDLPFFDLNLPRIRTLERLSDFVLCGQFRYVADRKILRQLYADGVRLSLILYTGSFLLLGMPALFLFGIWYVVKGARRRSIGRPAAIVLGFLLFNIFYIAMTSNFLSSYETNRYRFPSDGLYVVLAALAVEQLVRKLKHSAVK
ncbi:MAG: hypothetical protein JW699_02325 [Chitinispirillaceae bacterium]|nr:hypothetical protein [Chitinispirillaceae bacterium]